MNPGRDATISRPNAITLTAVSTSPQAAKKIHPRSKMKTCSKSIHHSFERNQRRAADPRRFRPAAQLNHLKKTSKLVLVLVLRRRRVILHSLLHPCFPVGLEFLQLTLLIGREQLV